MLLLQFLIVFFFVESLPPHKKKKINLLYTDTCTRYREDLPLCQKALIWFYFLASYFHFQALTMNNQARKGATVGEIVNLMSVDTENIQHMIPYLWACWSSVLQIGVCLYFLYDTVKYAMFAGLGFLILLFPFNGVIMNMMQKLQKAKMKEKDNRIKLLTEVLNGIKVFYHLFQFSLLAMHVQFKGTGIHQSLRVSICHQAMVELLMI